MHVLKKLGFAFALFWIGQSIEGQSAFADQKCNDAMKISLSTRDVYNLFARVQPSTGDVTQLMVNAKTDFELRKQVNQTLLKNSFLKKSSEIGLTFKNSAKAFLAQEVVPANASLKSVLYPEKDLLERFLVFKNYENLSELKPISPTVAEAKARADVAALYPYGDVETNDPGAIRYYQERLNVHSQTTAQMSKAGEASNNRKFKVWVAHMLKQIQQYRFQNLVSCLQMIEKFEDKPTRLKVALNESVIKKLIRKVIVNINNEPVRVPIQKLQEIGMAFDDNYGSADAPTELELDDLEFSYASNSNEWAKRGIGVYGRYYDSKVYGERWVSLNGERLVFRAPDDAFNAHLEGRIQYHGLNNPKRGFYSILVERLEDQLQAYSIRVGNTNYEPGNRISDQLTLRLDRARDLSRLISILKSYQQVPDYRKFEETLVSASLQAEEQSLSPKEGSVSLLERMRVTDAQPEDELSGVEWFGYRLRKNYWSERSEKAAEQQQKENKKNKNPVAEDTAPEVSEDLSSFVTQESILKQAWRFGEDRLKRQKSELAKVIRKGLTIAASYYLLVGGVNTLHHFSAAGAHSSYHQRSSLNFRNSNSLNFNESNLDGNALDVMESIKAVDRNMDGELYYRKSLYVAAVSPRYFNYANETEVNDPSHLIDLPEWSFSKNNQETPAKDLSVGDQKHEVRYWSAVNFEVDHGYVSLPRPEGFKITYLKLRTNGHEDEEVFDGLKMHDQTGNYLIKIKNEFKENPVQVNAAFEKIISDSIHSTRPELVSLSDSRFSNLDKTKLGHIRDEIQHAGLVDLSASLTRLIESPMEIQIEDIAQSISESSIYSLKAGASDWSSRWSENPYRKFSRFLVDDRVLYLKCFTAEALLRTLLKEYYAQETDIEIDPFSSLVYSGTDHAAGVIGHVRTQVRVKNKPGVRILDATPTLHEDGFTKSPWQNYDREQLEKDFETAKNSNQKKTPKDLTPLPKGEEWLPDSQEGDGVKTEKIPENELAQKRRLAQSLALFLRDASKRLLENPAFEGIVKGRRPGEVPPPQRMYILMKTVERYASFESSLMELHARMTGLYPSLNLSLPTSAKELQNNFAAIRSYESVIWNRLREKAVRNPGSSYAWALDITLKSLSLDEIESLEWFSFSWGAFQPLETQ